MTAAPLVINVTINWQEILMKFESDFLEIFPEGNSKRLYFFDKTVIDGATASWVPVSLIGGILELVEGTYKVSFLSSLLF